MAVVVTVTAALIFILIVAIVITFGVVVTVVAVVVESFRIDWTTGGRSRVVVRLQRLTHRRSLLAFALLLSDQPLDALLFLATDCQADRFAVVSEEEDKVRIWNGKLL